MDLNKQFLTRYHDQNKAQIEYKDIRDTIYIGERSNFTIQTHYGIITKAFNDKSDKGPIYSLTEKPKVTKFEGGLKEEISPEFLLRITQTGSYLMTLEINLSTTIISYSHCS